MGVQITDDMLIGLGTNHLHFRIIDERDIPQDTYHQLTEAGGERAKAPGLKKVDIDYHHHKSNYPSNNRSEGPETDFLLDIVSNNQTHSDLHADRYRISNRYSNKLRTVKWKIQLFNSQDQDLKLDSQIADGGNSGNNNSGTQKSYSEMFEELLKSKLGPSYVWFNLFNCSSTQQIMVFVQESEE